MSKNFSTIVKLKHLPNKNITKWYMRSESESTRAHLLQLEVVRPLSVDKNAIDVVAFLGLCISYSELDWQWFSWLQ